LTDIAVLRGLADPTADNCFPRSLCWLMPRRRLASPWRW
jgi:hypothetical protein